ncbi:MULTISPECIES: FbpB family small basic protein [Metabacillus]|uniref:FbpB family small basic protein n=1 Tax=Metabacillus hrfriensis TaxID=3048891 RepID=A0ACD4REW2_9BACI|nr:MULTISPECIES: FbpB family small basic protein [Metabacillus]UAL53472.1 FbpB family small basic protein [Metabacillus dongyingensis]UOK58963.1 FbpB family small basic protein [Bacillus sp. OVS6]USK29797.1 FbpB family small basic protein [Bacillus sp. CMF21]WHZ59044.1 FbpB family small basic protein [Metabacillus sp. CT-WN-B3]
MKKVRGSIEKLIRENKEELLKDKRQLEKIEKRIDDKYSKVKS